MTKSNLVFVDAKTVSFDIHANAFPARIIGWSSKI